MKAKEMDLLRSTRKAMYQTCEPTTQKGMRNAFSRWVDFCDDRKIKTLRAFDLDAAIAWVGHVRDRFDNPKTVRHTAIPPLRALELLQQMDPKSVSPKFVFPAAHIPAVTNAYHGDVMNVATLFRIMEVCYAEITEAKTITRDTLLPFVLLFAIRTGMNAQSILNIQRDCVVKHPTKTGSWVHWEKKRSAGAMKDYYEPAQMGPLEIVATLAPKTQGDLLFTYATKGERWVPFTFAPGQLAAWCRKHRFPEFTLAEVRPAMASHLYVISKGDVNQVKRFLHHAHKSTTLAYISENVARPLHEAQIADAQAEMFARWGILPPPS